MYKDNKYIIYKSNYFLISVDICNAKLYALVSWYILKNKLESFFTFSVADSKITFAIDPFNAGSSILNSFPKILT